MSIGRYFTEMLDPSMGWNDVAGGFCLKGVMSVEDAKRAAEHWNRSVKPRRATARWLARTVRSASGGRRCVGDRLDVMMDGGVQRVLKALALGAKAVGWDASICFLWPLQAARALNGHWAFCVRKSSAE